MLKENLRLIIPLGIAVVLLGGIYLAHHYQDQGKVVSACGLRDDKTVTIGSKKIAVQVSTSPQAQAKGLGGLPCISQDEGMLFIFNKPGQYRFWMKDMKFAIDMVWVDTSHRAVTVEENVLPSTYLSKYPFFINPQNKPAKYVLELKAHSTTKLNINPGTLIKF